MEGKQKPRAALRSWWTVRFMVVCLVRTGFDNAGNSANEGSYPARGLPQPSLTNLPTPVPPR